MRYPSINTILICLVPGIFALACSHSAPASNGNTKKPAIKSAAPEDDAYTATQEDLNSLVKGNGEFALRLFNALREQEGNLFFSPFSISAALSMTSAGASGNTKSEMLEALAYSMDDEVLHPSWERLSAGIDKAGQDDKVSMSTANRLFVQEGFQLKQDFENVCAQKYSAGTGMMNFMGDPEKSRKSINAWVKEKTADKIRELVPKGVISTLTRLVLVNAIHFKAAWEHVFDPERTKKAPFYPEECRKTQADFMFMEKSLLHAYVEGGRVLELPYAGSALSFMIFLPDAGTDIGVFEKNLDAGKISSWISGLKKTYLRVYVPKFKISSGFKLAQVLTELGIREAFDPLKADFSGITDKREGFYIQDVIHQAVVEVDEAGTEASAATAVHGMVMSAAVPPKPESFEADGPFIFIIRHNDSKSILFMGRVANPSPGRKVKKTTCGQRRPLYCEGMYLRRPECMKKNDK